MTEMQQVLSKLDEISDKVNKLHEWKAALDERCEHHRGETNEMKVILYGNPEGGLVSDVQRLQNCKENVKANTARWKDLLFGVLKTVITTGIILMAIWLLALYKTMK